MNLDYTLIQEMYNAGMDLREIKELLIKQNPENAIVSIARLREICNNQIKTKGGKSSAKNDNEDTETISVHGKLVKVKKQGSSSMPQEVRDKIQENMVMASTACATCAFRPIPGHSCAWPAGVCSFGHTKPLTYNPQELIAQANALKNKYKPHEPETTILPPSKLPAKTRKSVKSLFEEDSDTTADSAELQQLEGDIAKESEAMSAHERIGAALRSMKENEKQQYTEIDGFDADNTDIDDALEQAAAEFDAADAEELDLADVGASEVDFEELDKELSDFS